MAKLTIVRHAQASFGAADYDNLSELGHQQSQVLGEHLSRQRQVFDHVITGNMKRHKQTAHGIMKGIGTQDIEVDSCWDEFDFDAIVRSYLSAHPSEVPAKDAPRSAWYKLLRRAMKMWSQASLPEYSGESWCDFENRVKQARAKIAQSHHNNVLVVSSGGAMAVFMMQCLHTSVDQAIAFNLQIRNTSVTEYFFNNKGFQLSMFNSVAHLDCPEHSAKITYS